MVDESTSAQSERARRLLDRYSPGYSYCEIDMDFAYRNSTQWENYRTVHFMLDSYDLSKVDKSNKHEMRLLLAACGISNFNFIKRWKSHGLPFNITDSHGNTPLHYAVQLGPDQENFASIVQYLVDECDVNPNARNGTGSNALIFGLDRLNFESDDYAHRRLLIKELVRAGVDVNDENPKGCTALGAMEFYDHRSVELLFDLGADINILVLVVDYLIDELDQCDSVDSVFEEQLKASGKLIRHAIRMNVLGLYVSDGTSSVMECLIDTVEEVKQEHARYEDHSVFQNDELNFDEEHIEKFRKQCELEKKNMRMTKLDGVNSMIDLALKSEGEIMEFAYKEVFQTYFHSDKCTKDFPIYSYILNLQFQAAEKRKLRLLPNAKNFLTTFNLPLYDLCLDNILKYFTNKELQEFIDVMRSEV